MLNAEDVRTLCIKNHWFTGGSNEQYNKLFELVEKKSPVTHIAIAIWLCSPNADRFDIERKLRRLNR